MKSVAALLIVLALATYGGSRWLGGVLGYPSAGMAYILQGIWSATLCAVLLGIFLQYRRTVATGVVLLALFVGVSEGLQMSVCRLAITDMSAVPKGTNLCDHLTGLPIGAAMMGVYILALCYFLRPKK